jgi:alanyl-tRNA synthetase
LYVLVADGAPPPGKNGRERIIKLLIRQIITRQMVLGIHCNTFLPDILQVVATTFAADEMPSWTTSRVMAYFTSESSRFEQTITRGIHKLKMLLTRNSGESLNGKEIVTLEKQWGLPAILIERQLNQRGLAFARQDYLYELDTWAATARMSH